MISQYKSTFLISSSKRQMISIAIFSFPSDEFSMRFLTFFVNKSQFPGLAVSLKYLRMLKIKAYCISFSNLRGLISDSIFLLRYSTKISHIHKNEKIINTVSAQKNITFCADSQNCGKSIILSKNNTTKGTETVITKGLLIFAMLQMVKGFWGVHCSASPLLIFAKIIKQF